MSKITSNPPKISRALSKGILSGVMYRGRGGIAHCFRWSETPADDDRFIRCRLHGLRKGGQRATLHVIAPAFNNADGPVILEDLQCCE